MKKILNILVKTGIPLLLGAVILYWIYRNFNFEEVSLAFKSMDMWWFWLSCVFGVLSHAIRGWRWNLTLAPLGYYPSSSNCVYSIFIAYAANLIVPRIGEVSRCIVLERYDKVPFAQSLGTLVSERLVDTLMVVIITAIAVLSQWHVFYAFVADSGTSDSVTVFSSIGRVAVFVLSAIAVGILLYLLLRRMSLWVKIRSFISRFWAGFTSLAKMRNLWLFIAETVAIWLC